MRKISLISIFCTCIFLMSCSAGKEKIVCLGNSQSDLAQLLEGEGYRLQYCTSVQEALEEAPEQSGVLLLNTTYPEQGTVLSTDDLVKMKAKSLRVLVEFPSSWARMFV